MWYPDSAYKTAQAIQDFNKGENLPLIIFANWRGFSGGTRDMYGEILKFGAMIVDSLRNYKHPVFVYIPPNGELRGGAWVVIDPTINPDKMEMYADKQARGGILEPPGICEVKYRSQDQRLTMQRLDPVLQQLNEELSQSPSDEEAAKISADIKQREKLLAPLYLQVLFCTGTVLQCFYICNALVLCSYRGIYLNTDYYSITILSLLAITVCPLFH